MADTLEYTTKFLAKRDGIDKTLKLIRYVSKLNVTLSEASDTTNALKNLEKSISVSRKAFRFGKFLQCVHSARVRSGSGSVFWLGLLGDAGEGVYLFLDQVLWLMSVGLISNKSQKNVTKLTSIFEFIGYVGSVFTAYKSVQKLLGQIEELEDKLAKASKDGVAVDPKATEQVAKVRKQLLLKQVGLTQDIFDAVMCISDLRDNRDPVLGHPAVLASLGVVSGVCGFYKVWKA